MQIWTSSLLALEPAPHQLARSHSSPPVALGTSDPDDPDPFAASALSSLETKELSIYSCRSRSKAVPPGAATDETREAVLLDASFLGPPSMPGDVSWRTSLVPIEIASAHSRIHSSRLPRWTLLALVVAMIIGIGAAVTVRSDDAAPTAQPAPAAAVDRGSAITATPIEDGVAPSSTKPATSTGH